MEANEIGKALNREAGDNPENEALLADSIGLALLVVLGTLSPDERVAFVLHDIFAVPFAEIASIVGRSDAATRQMATRARRRLQSANTSSKTDLSIQRELVVSFLAAARSGDLDALVKVLDPGVVLRDDRENTPNEIRGTHAVAEQLMSKRAKAAQPALINGEVGVVVSPGGRLHLILTLTYANGKIIGVDVISNPAHMKEIDWVTLNEEQD